MQLKKEKFRNPLGKETKYNLKVWNILQMDTCVKDAQDLGVKYAQDPGFSKVGMAELVNALGLGSYPP